MLPPENSDHGAHHRLHEAVARISNHMLSLHLATEVTFPALREGAPDLLVWRGAGQCPERCVPPALHVACSGLFVLDVRGESSAIRCGVVGELQRAKFCEPGLLKTLLRQP